MARAKFYNKKTGKWEYADTAYGGSSNGEPGADGKDGVSATHSWNGTVLTVTSASGTSSADLKGEPGKDGNTGKDGYTPQKGIDYFDGKDGKDGQPGADGKDYVLTYADKQEIAEIAADMVDVPTDDHINGLINTALGVIENGTY